MVGGVNGVKLLQFTKFFVAISQTATEIMWFFIVLQDYGCPPSWIRGARVWTTHEWHLVVFSTLENLVGIDTVVSIICKF